MRAASAFAAYIVISGFVLTACSESTPTSVSDVTAKSTAYPAFVDEDVNGVNDYLELTRHEGNGHIFLDSDNDGICDYGQDGSPTWHGPGFIDGDGDGVCDYWQPGAKHHNRHEGLHYRDDNGNHVNDYQERFRHLGDGHPFGDANGDGICDPAQDGGPAWHGPGFSDTDGNGFHDRWGGGNRGPHYRRS